MNKNNTTESTLNIIRTMCAERDRREQSVLESNRLKREEREAAEKERMQSTNSILNSYIEKAKARENQHSQERSRMVQNMHDEKERRRAESDLRSQELSSAIDRGIRNAKEKENENRNRNTADAFMDRNKRLLDKGREAVKRQQSKNYFG